MAKPEFENTIRFVCRVVAPLDHGQYFLPKRSRSQSYDEWVRNWEITGLYLGTDQILEEIGAKFDLTHERIRQITKKNLARLYGSSDKQTREEFPWESLATNKPLSIRARRERSDAKGGTLTKVEDLTKRELSFWEIKTMLNIPGIKLSRQRLRLRKWDTALPYEQRADSPVYKQNLDRLLTGTLEYQEAQAVIDQLTRRSLATHSSGGKPDFLSVTKLAKHSGIFINPRQVHLLINVLKDHQIPTCLIEEGIRSQHHQRYYFIPSCYEERAIKILQGLSATF